MTKQEITSLALKFFAMYLFANVLFVLPQTLLTQTLLADMFKTAGEEGPGIVFAWAVGGFILVVGVILSFILWRIANSLVATTANEDNSPVSSFPRGELEPLIVAGIGLFFVMDAIVSLGYYGVNLFEIPTAELKTTSVLNVVVTFVQFIVAGSLVTHPIWWSGVFRKARPKMSSNKALNSDAR